jgi:hypothetical protein
VIQGLRAEGNYAPTDADRPAPTSLPRTLPDITAKVIERLKQAK